MDNYYKLYLIVKKRKLRQAVTCVHNVQISEVCMHSMSTYIQTFVLVFQKD